MSQLPQVSARQMLAALQRRVSQLKFKCMTKLLEKALDAVRQLPT
jgi:hypothetical protein